MYKRQAGERAGGLLKLLALEQERAEQRAQLLLRGVRRGAADVRPHRRVVVKGFVLLREVPDAQPVTRHDLARVGPLHAAQQPQQGRLARTVEAEHDDLGAAVDGEVHAGEDLQ